MLEVCLKQHYEEVEGRKPSLDAYKLIEWGEQKLGKKKELALGFRILRNLLHEDIIIQEQDALEAIRHVSQILNIVFPFGSAELNGQCSFCNALYTFPLQSVQCYLGNRFHIPCTNCQRNTIHFIMPAYPTP